MHVGMCSPLCDFVFGFFFFVLFLLVEKDSEDAGLLTTVSDKSPNPSVTTRPGHVYGVDGPGHMHSSTKEPQLMHVGGGG